MRRRGAAGPRLDIVDVLQVRRSARMAGIEAMDPDVRASFRAALDGMAVEFGFPSVDAMIAEADELHAERFGEGSHRTR